MNELLEMIDEFEGLKEEYEAADALENPRKKIFIEEVPEELNDDNENND
jgi:hypothetical protein